LSVNAITSPFDCYVLTDTNVHVEKRHLVIKCDVIIIAKSHSRSQVLVHSTINAHTCLFLIVLAKAKKMTPLLVESDEFENVDLELVWLYISENKGHRYSKLYIFLKLVMRRLHQYMF